MDGGQKESEEEGRTPLALLLLGLQEPFQGHGSVKAHEGGTVTVAQRPPFREVYRCCTKSLPVCTRVTIPTPDRIDRSARLMAAAPGTGVRNHFAPSWHRYCCTNGQGLLETFRGGSLRCSAEKSIRKRGRPRQTAQTFPRGPDKGATPPSLADRVNVECSRWSKASRTPPYSPVAGLDFQKMVRTASCAYGVPTSQPPHTEA